MDTNLEHLEFILDNHILNNLRGDLAEVGSDQINPIRLQVSDKKRVEPVQPAHLYNEVIADKLANKELIIAVDDEHGIKLYDAGQLLLPYAHLCRMGFGLRLMGGSWFDIGLGENLMETEMQVDAILQLHPSIELLGGVYEVLGDEVQFSLQPRCRLGLAIDAHGRHR